MTYKFIDDDSGYWEWVNANSNGFVLDIERQTRTKNFILHKVTCPEVSGEPMVRREWTTHHIKVCSSDKSELDKWNQVEGHGEIIACKLCKP